MEQNLSDLRAVKSRVFDLSAPGARVEAEMREIMGRRAAARTRCVLTREQGIIRVEVHAEDPDMPSLISTISPPGKDRFLYEEDCVQLAVAGASAAKEDDYLLVNPHGTRSGTPSALKWPVQPERLPHGWKLVVQVPTPPGEAFFGLSLHRFFRGCNHEVQGIEDNLPYPLEPARFSVVLLKPGKNPEQLAARHRHSALEAVQRNIEQKLNDIRDRIARAAGGHEASIETAKTFALARLAGPCDPVKGMWNETYLQHALIDLWELERDPKWIEAAIPRAEHAWSMRSDRIGAVDTLWGVARPTWYDDVAGCADTLASGVILDPIVRLMRTIHDEPELRRFWPRVEPWCALAEEVIAVHDPEWVELAGGCGFYIEPYQKGPGRVYPSGGSRLCPFNRALWLGRPMLNLARILGRNGYLRKVEMMSRYFLANCETMDNGSLVWEYLAQPYPAAGEDLSHAHCQVLFAELCFAEGIAFTEDDMRRMAATLEKNVMRYGDVPCGTVRGLDPGLHFAVASWSSLCRYVPHVLPRIVAVLETAMAEGGFDFRREGWGVRLLTMVEKARRNAGCPPARAKP